jgi:hypothetical protein
MSIDASREKSTIALICDDALGGYTAIDSRKFASEFIKRREAAKAGIPISSIQGSLEISSSIDDSDGWTPVGVGSKPSTAEPLATVAISENKFVTVSKGKKKKNRK